MDPIPCICHDPLQLQTIIVEIGTTAAAPDPSYTSYKYSGMFHNPSITLSTPDSKEHQQ